MRLMHILIVNLYYGSVIDFFFGFFYETVMNAGLQASHHPDWYMELWK